MRSAQRHTMKLLCCAWLATFLPVPVPVVEVARLVLCAREAWHVQEMYREHDTKQVWAWCTRLVMQVCAVPCVL